MLEYLDKTIMGMALLRFFSGSIEIFVAFLILKYNDIEKALVVNSSLALVGPLVLILTTAIGLVGISDKLSISKLAWIFSGVILIIYGVKSN